MNPFDLVILESINQLARQSVFFDLVVTFVSGNGLFKGAVLMGFIWWGWFRAGEGQARARMHLISTLFAAVLGMALARGLALVLPFRSRPVHLKDIDFIFPYGMSPRQLEDWSSFPSDHAVLFFILVGGIFFVSKKAGWIATGYTFLFITLPRIYMGLHYPTDVIAGAILGVALVLLLNLEFFVNRISRPVLAWCDSKPELFYPLFFLFSYQVAELFDSSRMVGRLLYVVIFQL